MTGPQRLLETYIYLYQIIEWFNSSFITLLTMIIKSVSGNSNNPPEIVPSHVTVASSANLLFVRLVSIGCAHGEICKQSSHWRKKKRCSLKRPLKTLDNFTANLILIDTQYSRNAIYILLYKILSNY